MGQQGRGAFSAFVSYSHADKKAAQKLHRRLEGYRLPRHVVAKLADDASSSDPAKLGQIFRDREDLPAAQDLSESVKAALLVSQVLIVLCSPAAKASPWVAREIETFRELHPDRPVLAALLEGEPADAFPEPLLQGCEPLAADLRKQGDGPRLGFLKVVAGIAAVPLDALVQRDAQRRVRRVMLVTGGAVAAMLAMAIMTFIAIQSRNEAQRQRAEAEGLVEYMLTDLRDELKGVGRLDVMTDVNERAMGYYEGQGDLSAMPADSLERRARILHAMGEDDEKRGDLKRALAKFAEAHRVTAALLERDSENPQRIFGHAQSEYWLGHAYFEQQDTGRAKMNFRNYRDLAYRLLDINPNKAEWIKEAGYSEGNLCAMALQPPKNPDEAIAACSRATQKFVRLNIMNSNDPMLLSDLANRYGWDADAYLAAGQIDNALEKRKKQVKILAKASLLAPRSVEIVQNVMLGNISLAEIQFRMGKFSDANVHLNKAQRQFEFLKRNDPSNSKWREWGGRIERLHKNVKGR